MTGPAGHNADCVIWVENGKGERQLQLRLLLSCQSGANLRILVALSQK